MSNLSAKLVKSPHFAWRPGMFGFSPSENVYHRYVGGGAWVDDDNRVLRNCRLSDRQPHLFDPATLGALLALVRGLYKAPKAYVKWDALNNDYFVGGLDVTITLPRGPSEGEALANAILQVKP